MYIILSCPASHTPPAGTGIRGTSQAALQRIYDALQNLAEHGHRQVYGDPGAHLRCCAAFGQRDPHLMRIAYRRGFFGSVSLAYTRPFQRVSSGDAEDNYAVTAVQQEAEGFVHTLRASLWLASSTRCADDDFGFHWVPGPRGSLADPARTLDLITALRQSKTAITPYGQQFRPMHAIMDVQHKRAPKPKRAPPGAPASPVNVAASGQHAPAAPPGAPASPFNVAASGQLASSSKASAVPRSAMHAEPGSAAAAAAASEAAGEVNPWETPADANAAAAAASGQPDTAASAAAPADAVTADAAPAPAADAAAVAASGQPDAAASAAAPAGAVAAAAAPTPAADAAAVAASGQPDAAASTPAPAVAKPPLPPPSEAPKAAEALAAHLAAAAADAASEEPPMRVFPSAGMAVPKGPPACLFPGQPSAAESPFRAAGSADVRLHAASGQQASGSGHQRYRAPGHMGQGRGTGKGRGAREFERNPVLARAASGQRSLGTTSKHGSGKGPAVPASTMSSESRPVAWFARLELGRQVVAWLARLELG